jgi:hypothetical protein
MVRRKDSGIVAAVEMDRYYRILKRVIFELPPLTDETPEETALRQQLTAGVNEIRARRDSVDPQRLGVG